jgi:hypothetical protein
MSTSMVTVRELIAWGVDEYSFRNAGAHFNHEELEKKIAQARESLCECKIYSDALLTKKTESIQDLLRVASQRDDLNQECEGLDWTLGVVDLRRILSFQRRLVFSSKRKRLISCKRNDWPSLISLSIGTRRSTEHQLVRTDCAADSLDISLHSSNPDLQFRLDATQSAAGLSPLSLYGGSPFLEVARLRDRWFLRDGYHRAYDLLRAEIHHVPAVIVFARTIEEVGAIEPWFFNEDQLFSERPPRVTDFLDESLVLSYKRIALHKVIRVRIDESLEPFDEIEDRQGEEQ